MAPLLRGCPAPSKAPVPGPAGKPGLGTPSHPGLSSRHLSFLSRASTSPLLRARQLHLRGVAVDGRPVGLPQFRVPGVGPGTRLLVVDGAQDRLAQASPEAEELPHGATSQTQPPTSQTEGAPRRR